MTGRRSRNKGAVAEREWAAKLREHGFDATRNRIGAAGDDILHAIPGISFEVKRQETLCVPKWCAQADAQAGAARVPVVAYRTSRQPWRVIVPADHYLGLLRAYEDRREVVA